MTYSAVVRRLLISCPGDVPLDDLATIQKAINRWNGIYGEQFGAVVIPISWGTHAAAEFGRPPQALLNDQLVDGCDICLALFANRLGTPTATAESGTAEEIERLSSSGKYVGILRSRRLVDPSTIDHTQAKRLDDYLGQISRNSLVLDYADDAQLSQHVDTMLVAAISRDQGRTAGMLQTATAAPERVAEVWPRVTSAERTRSTQRGLQVSKNWYLVLHNTGSAPARNVYFELEKARSSDSGSDWTVHSDAPTGEPQIEILAPNGELKFPLLTHMGMAGEARCTVSWDDDRGRQSNIASLRLS